MKKTHGHAGRYTSLTYRSWQHMRGRCLTPTDRKYPAYGGRGITICAEWSTFEQFLADLGPKPEGMTLGRKDNDGPYCKENCEWQTPKQQANNRRPKTVQRNSVSGIKGVRFFRKRHMWQALAYPGGHQAISLYWGPDFFEAVCARKSWEAENGI